MTILQSNSYLPKDLLYMDNALSTFNLVKLDTLVPVTGTITLAKIPDGKVSPADPDTFLNGRVLVTIPDTVTSTLVFDRGPKVDGYYIKPTYEGIISIKFTNGDTNIIAIVPDISIIPIGE
jgi:hypothetical protein